VGTSATSPATLIPYTTLVRAAPVANNQSVTVTEDTPRAIVLSGSDVDGDPLTFSIVIGPTNGVISGLDTNTGALTYTPNSNFNDIDSSTFKTQDGTRDSVPAT